MKDPFAIAEQYLDQEPFSPPIRAVELCPTVLDANIWVVADSSFEPGDELGLFYAEELPILREKRPAQLKEIHKVKLVFGPGSIVRQ